MSRRARLPTRWPISVQPPSATGRDRKNVISLFQQRSIPSAGVPFDFWNCSAQIRLQKWRQLFDKFDPEGFGEILWEDFLRALDSADFEEGIDCTKRELFRLKAQDRRTNAITFDEFIAVVRNTDNGDDDDDEDETNANDEGNSTNNNDADSRR